MGAAPTSRYRYPTSVVRKNAASVQIGATTYGYDAHGRQYQVTDSRNGTTTVAFNAADTTIQVTSSKQHVP